MGRTRLPKYELQIEVDAGCSLVHGVNKLEEVDAIIQEVIEGGMNLFGNQVTGNFYVWGNSYQGKRYIENQDADYFLYSIKNGGIIREKRRIKEEVPDE